MVKKLISIDNIFFIKPISKLLIAIYNKMNPLRLNNPP